MNRIILLFSLALVTFSSCKKEESPDPEPVDIIKPGPRAQIILASKWKLTDKTIEYSNGLPTETFSNVPPCRKDNLIQFKITKVYEIDEATDVCPGNSPISLQNWTISDDENQLTLANTTYSILIVNSTTLQIRYTSITPNLTVVDTETYTAQ